MGYPTLWKTRMPSSQPIQLPIAINSIPGPFSYMYMISYNWGDGDTTYYEFGIIRIGYSGNNVTKTVLSERPRSDISFSFSYDSNGNVTLVANSTSSYPSVNVRLFG